jgi:hypothetical protein
MRISHVSRTSNEEADVLTNIGSQCLPIPAGVFWEEIIERSIPTAKSSGSKKVKQQSTTGSGAAAVEEEQDSALEPEDVMTVEVTWMQPYLAYMINKQLPEDVVTAK